MLCGPSNQDDNKVYCGEIYPSNERRTIRCSVEE